MKIKLTIAVLGLLILLIILGLSSPFFKSWQPSAQAINAGAPSKVLIKDLTEGVPFDVEWRGKPYSILLLSQQGKAELELFAPHVCRPTDTKHPSIVVVEKVSSYLGCIVVRQPKQEDSQWQGGYRDPCHGYLYDYAGRIVDNTAPAKNFPPHATSGTKACHLPDLAVPNFSVSDGVITIHQ
ncbi:MAG: hypothetical protein HWE13_16085 [Gammaproteobacteria bacterium]|nr:hypothetical protein [Gammaproteobacteria bacterium]